MICMSILNTCKMKMFHATTLTKNIYPDSCAGVRVEEGFGDPEVVLQLLVPASPRLQHHDQVEN